MQDAVDAQLVDQQAGFREGQPCMDRIVTLQAIAEQPVEWNSSLQLNIIDYEKAFGSLDRKTYGKFFDTMVDLRKSSTSSVIHMMDYSAKSCIEDS
ncbi:unnamed protein product [Schistosoma curassoni]|uniref:Reverse transcriptase domain-containing protein n=1 Tax=Schistosoma curassoni TaxID=6186 RepID=A0A183L628_9TREM|nr:unnamed protein product [Schistosoma curassoni]